MSKKDERFWEVLGAVVVVLFLLVGAFRLGYYAGDRPNPNEQKAIDSMNATLEVLYSTDMYDGDVPFEEVIDAVTDNIYDALAWLERAP